ncbi:methylated-DNA--protein-cysteine methyltransferase [Drosophila madeirensis]|uniref:Methylated-DNA--protein-cysteine methyltransferase n=1 Tax=Drosophila madeirensis TaxID=30013 RepID=A0AAU9F6B4_DROMD
MWFTENLKIRLTMMSRRPRQISYGFVDTRFGRMLLGVVSLDDVQSEAQDAICLLYFVMENDEDTLGEAIQRSHGAKMVKESAIIQKWSDKLFSGGKDVEECVIDVAILGTPFETAVWSALLEVKSGQTYTYMQLATQMGRPEVVRSLASAVGRNEVAILIPCHRIVSKNGDSKYHWGGRLKLELLSFEQATK